MERIRYFRKRKGWTQEQLATKLGVKRSVVSKYESGYISPSVEMLKNIADALDVHVSALYGEEIHDGLLKDTLNVFEEYALALKQQEAIRVLGGKYIEKFVFALNDLNMDGRWRVVNHAVDYAHDLAKIPEYQREQPTEPSQSTPPPSEGKDTTMPAGGPETPPERE